jgi:hypothetical protein
MTRTLCLLFGVAAFACRPAASPASASAGGFRVAALATVWSKTFPPSGRNGVCPERWTADRDGAIFMTGQFTRELKLDEVRLTSGAESNYLARLSSRGEPEWGIALPALGAAGEPAFVRELALFGDRVFVVAVASDGPVVRLSYAKTGVLEGREEVAAGEAALPRLLDAESWIVVEPSSEGTMRVRYRDGHGRTWQKSYSASHTAPAASSADGRIAILGTLEEAESGADNRDRVSVLESASGKPLFAVPLPTDARVSHLGFDSKHRLWISGAGPGASLFLFAIDRQGERVGRFETGEGAELSDAPVFSSDGRVVLGMRATGRVAARTSFAGDATFAPGESLLELDLDAKRVTRYDVPSDTSCLAPTADGDLLACVQHFVKQGQFSWPARCDLVEWDLGRERR